MRNILQVRIIQENGFYTAECLDFPIVTQGKTLDELMKNLNEAIQLHFEEEKLEDYDVSSKPTFLANFEFSPFAYA